MKFYDRCKKSRKPEDEKKLIEEYVKAKEAGDDALKKLLIDSDAITNNGSEYFNPGRGHKNNRYIGPCFKKDGSEQPMENEKRICKCLFVKSLGQKETDCSGCIFCSEERRKYVKGNYSVEDYEVPVCADGFSKSNIDLLLKDKTSETLYATEVKPPENNSESILRMVAEIITYLFVLKKTHPELDYQPAIAFFEDSKQDNKFKESSSELKELIKAEGITVFYFRKDTEETWAIEKL